MLSKLRLVVLVTGMCGMTIAATFYEGINIGGQASPFEGEQFSAISSGEIHTCALRPDGSPVCWSYWDWVTYQEDHGPFEFEIKSVRCPPLDRRQGDDRCRRFSEGRFRLRALLGGTHYASIPPRDPRLGVISSGWGHTCALLLDGSPVCWGWLQIGVPFKDQSFKAISDGDSHTCRLKLKEEGYTSGGPSVCRGFATLPDERFAAISSGGSHACALRLDGSPVCWGSNREGQASPPERDRHDIDQLVTPGAVYTRVYQVRKMLRQRRTYTICHGSPPPYD